MNAPGELSPYFNRELSWLAFNRRVLAEAADPKNPALERMRFLSITASNLDEFFMVRFAALRRRVLAGDKTPDPAGLTPREQALRVAEDARRFQEEQARTFSAHVLPALEEAGLRFLPRIAWSREQARWAETRFTHDILPVLLLPTRRGKLPLPPVPGRAHQLGLLLEKKGAPALVLARALTPLPRVWHVPRALGGGLMLLEEIAAAFAGQLAPGLRVTGCWPFRITRDENFTAADETGEELLARTRKSLRRRKTGDVVRLEVAHNAPEAFVLGLAALFSAPEETVYRLPGPLGLTFLNRELYAAKGLEALRYPPFESRMPQALAQADDLFAALRAGDIFLHHPYDSFDAVLRLVRDAARDPRVLAIKQTLYRVGGDSPVVKALCEAAEAGKRVTVLLEVKARFDEENNIHWGKVLERAGCEVLYGLSSLKTHAKITLIVRRERMGLRRYLHLGTGNYNNVTARQYTDMGLLTSDETLGEDAQAFFNMLTGFSREPRMKKLVYAPHTLRPALERLVRGEAERALRGEPCGIFAKMNSLVDPGVIRLLYEAGGRGVPIRLIVRGVCCLRPGVPGLSETIQVRSLVGRFLEHSRVFRFENGGAPLLFLSSADWMPRNLNRRVELMFPAEDPAVVAQVQDVLDTQWRDTANAWILTPEGAYRRAPQEGDVVDAQALPAEDGAEAGRALNATNAAATASTL